MKYFITQFLVIALVSAVPAFSEPKSRFSCSLAFNPSRFERRNNIYNSDRPLSPPTENILLEDNDNADTDEDDRLTETGQELSQEIQAWIQEEKDVYDIGFKIMALFLGNLEADKNAFINLLETGSLSDLWFEPTFEHLERSVSMHYSHFMSFEPAWWAALDNIAVRLNLPSTQSLQLMFREMILDIRIIQEHVRSKILRATIAKLREAFNSTTLDHKLQDAHQNIELVD